MLMPHQYGSRTRDETRRVICWRTAPTQPMSGGTALSDMAHLKRMTADQRSGLLVLPRNPMPNLSDGEQHGSLAQFRVMGGRLVFRDTRWETGVARQDTESSSSV